MVLTLDFGKPIDKFPDPLPHLQSNCIAIQYTTNSTCFNILPDTAHRQPHQVLRKSRTLFLQAPSSHYLQSTCLQVPAREYNKKLIRAGQPYQLIGLFGKERHRNRLKQTNKDQRIFTVIVEC